MTTPGAQSRLAAKRSRRLHCNISEELHARLQREARRPGVTRTVIVETALKLFFSGELADERDGALVRRFDHLGRRLAAQDQSLEVIAEMTASFIRLFLMLTPPLPSEEQEAARALGLRRFSHFQDELARTLAAGEGVLGAIELAAPHDGFFSEAEIGALKAARAHDASRSEAPPDE